MLKKIRTSFELVMFVVGERLVAEIFELRSMAPESSAPPLPVIRPVNEGLVSAVHVTAAPAAPDPLTEISEFADVMLAT